MSELKAQGASLAQSAARQSHNLKVVSSSLTGGTDYFLFLPPQNQLTFIFLKDFFKHRMVSVHGCVCVCVCVFERGGTNSQTFTVSASTVWSDIYSLSLYGLVRHLQSQPLRFGQTFTVSASTVWSDIYSLSLYGLVRHLQSQPLRFGQTFTVSASTVWSDIYSLSLYGLVTTGV